MSREISIKELQKFIKEIDYRPEMKSHYFLKLIEEVGELSEVIRKNKRLEDTNNIKGTIEEELFDILYYVLALSNVYGIDMEECIYLKEEINRIKYKRVSTLDKDENVDLK